MLFDKVVSCLPDDGWLHRAVDIDGETHIIEELQLFDKPQPVQSMVISAALVCTHACRVTQNERLNSLFMLIKTFDRVRSV